MIKYLGSKRTLVPLISSVAAHLPVRSACDLFAGTTRVGQALRRLGLAVHSNDLATYSEVLGRAYVEAGDVDRERLEALLAELRALPGRDGWFTEAFCRRARYFQPQNGERIEAIREAIEGYALPPVECALLLTSLLLAADRVDSTTGNRPSPMRCRARERSSLSGSTGSVGMSPPYGRLVEFVLNTGPQRETRLPKLTSAVPACWFGAPAAGQSVTRSETAYGWTLCFADGL